MGPGPGQRGGSGGGCQETGKFNWSVAPNDPGHDHLLQCASHCQLFHCGSFSCVNRLRTSWCVAPKVELLQLIQPCGELLSAVGGR